MKSDNYGRRSSFMQANIEPIKTGICLYNEANIICSWNASGEEVLSYKADEVIGKPISFIFPMIEKITRPGIYTVITGNHTLKRLYIEKSSMLGSNDEHLQVLSFSDQTEHLSQNTQSVGELHRDEQSGLYNHQSIVDLLNQEVKRALRYKRPFTVVVTRINGYEFVEEIHGEGSLDLIVQTLAIILKNETRDVDRLGRLSDEIFVVCLPDTDIRAAKIVANRISKVSGRYSDDETPFTVTTACMTTTEAVVDWQSEVMTLLSET